jgi:hypothetical protein
MPTSKVWSRRSRGRNQDMGFVERPNWATA